MQNLNRAQILGNLTRDPELKALPSGQSVLSFSVATNRRWRVPDSRSTPALAASGSQDWQEAVEYHNVVAWGRLAEGVAPQIRKGDPVYVEGRLQTRSWDAQDGSKRNRTEIVAEKIIVLSRKTADGSTTAPYSGQESTTTPATDANASPLELEGAMNEGGAIAPEDIPF